MSNKELLFFTSSISKMVHGQWRIHIRWFFSVWVVTKTLISSIGWSSFSIRHQQEQNCSLNNIIEFHVYLFSNVMQCCQLDFTKDLTSIKVLNYFVKIELETLIAIWKTSFFPNVSIWDEDIIMYDLEMEKPVAIFILPCNQAWL